MAIKNIAKKWNNQPVQNWSLIVGQLDIFFAGRLETKVMKEAMSRIKMNRLLESAGWRLFADVNGLHLSIVRTFHDCS